MKPTGILRRVDHLGRIVIPKELRVALEMDSGTDVEVLTDEGNIVLRPYSPEDACIITGEVSNDNMKLADGKIVLSEAGLEMLLYELKKKGDI